MKDPFKIIVTILFFSFFVNGTFAQKISSFDFSRCLMNLENDSSKIKVTNLSENKVKIQIHTYGSCNGNFDSGFELKDKLLNLKFWTKPIIIRDKEGNKSELVEKADCNCMFLLTYVIQGLSTEFFDIIYINGQSLKQIDEENISKEIDFLIQLDSLEK